jgi:hypothetical protein
VQLQIQAIHQAQGFELIFGQLIVETTLYLPPELFDALTDNFVIKLIVPVHRHPSF